MARRCPSCGKEKHRQSKICRKCSITKMRSPEHRANLSKKLKGKPSYVRTEATLKKMSESAKKVVKPTGWNHSEETRRKMAAYWTAERRQTKSLEVMGKCVDPEYRRRLGSPGESNPMWRGGACVSGYAPGFDSVLKLSIRTRDDFICQLCGVTETETGCNHSVHHIDYSKDNHDPENLATTCKACNSRVNTNESVWFDYFTVLADARRHFGKDVAKFIGRKVITQRQGRIIIDRV